MPDTLRSQAALRASQHAAEFLDGLPTRPVAVPADLAGLRAAFGGPVPEGPSDPSAVIDALVAAADPGLVATPGPRYFGFVTGGALPAAVAADWLTAAWDQSAALGVGSPAASVCEEVVAGWLLDLLGLPADSGVGLVTGGQMANTTCLAVARRTVLRRAGHNPDRDGLSGCPPVTVIVGAEAHSTIARALTFLGIGSSQIRPVAVGGQGAIAPGAVAAALAALPPGTPTIVCVQAGNVNSGAFDPFDDIADACAVHGAWLHIDGAFGLWAAVVPSRRGLLAGHHRADSWAVDLHKWLNVPYDSGVAILRDARNQVESLSVSAPYLQAGSGLRDGSAFVPELSRRARCFPAWAAIRSLGRQGIASMIAGCCELAARLARGVEVHPDVEVLNEVVINQVMVRVRDSDEGTRAMIAAVQAGGICWAGPTLWHGKMAMRVSVSNWSTTAADIDRSVSAILASVPKSA